MESMNFVITSLATNDMLGLFLLLSMALGIYYIAVTTSVGKINAISPESLLGRLRTTVKILTVAVTILLTFVIFSSIYGFASSLQSILITLAIFAFLPIPLLVVMTLFNKSCQLNIIQQIRRTKNISGYTESGPTSVLFCS